mmetsp:Transcript_90203/g.209884  ORF Transcript_90203/g.209884 Transcript_90203/m.209884 type:complete len:203 (-) Transcript_90203:831-1439(-)
MFREPPRALPLLRDPSSLRESSSSVPRESKRMMTKAPPTIARIEVVRSYHFLSSRLTQMENGSMSKWNCVWGTTSSGSLESLFWWLTWYATVPRGLTVLTTFMSCTHASWNLCVTKLWPSIGVTCATTSLGRSTQPFLWYLPFSGSEKERCFTRWDTFAIRTFRFWSPVPAVNSKCPGMRGTSNRPLALQPCSKASWFAAHP